MRVHRRLVAEKRVLDVNRGLSGYDVAEIDARDRPALGLEHRDELHPAFEPALLRPAAAARLEEAVSLAREDDRRVGLLLTAARPRCEERLAVNRRFLVARPGGRRGPAARYEHRQSGDDRDQNADGAEAERERAVRRSDVRGDRQHESLLLARIAEDGIGSRAQGRPSQAMVRRGKPRGDGRPCRSYGVHPACRGNRLTGPHFPRRSTSSGESDP